ncbi:hypothetical protein [Rhizobium sp. Rhizsp42]|uniref:hypothetical protein n=1 Tax=Rhizobium sp. Rhizsp42 TaxID=3243034 RepID=UPI0039B0F37C
MPGLFRGDRNVALSVSPARRVQYRSCVAAAAVIVLLGANWAAAQSARFCKSDVCDETVHETLVHCVSINPRADCNARSERYRAECYAECDRQYAVRRPEALTEAKPLTH